MPRVRIPLAQSIRSRTNSVAKDSRLVNGLWKTDGQRRFISKRPGYSALALSPAIAAGAGQGMFSWNNYLVAGVNNTIYLISGYTVVTNLGSIVGSTVPLSFTTVQGDTQLAFHNQSNLYTIAAGSPPIFTGGVGLSGVVSSVNIVTGGGFYGYDVACTLTLGANTTVTATSHGLVVGQGVTFTGTLPTGMSVGTTYQVSSVVDANNFIIHTATDGGGAGAAVATSGSSSGVTYEASPVVTFGASSGTTAVGVAVLFAHQVASVILTVHGAGYTTTPPITFGVPVLGITAQIALGSYSVGIHATTGTGTGYLSSPIVTDHNGGVVGYGIVDSHGQVATWYTTVGTGQFFPYTVTPPTATTATATAVMASAGITGPFAVGICYLEGYVYVMATNGNVYNSAFNDPTTWSGSYLTASSDPDDGIALVRHHNYLMALGQWSTEFLYNAGNPTGSPLAANDSAKLEIGCAHGNSVARAPETVIWVGQSQTFGRKVYMLAGLSPQTISNEYIENFLNADAMVNVRAYCLTLSGHTLYILTLKDSNITLVYDLDEGEWYQWTSQSGDNGTVNSGTETYFTPTFFDANIEYNPGKFVLHETNGKIYSMSSTLALDDGNYVYLRAITPREDSGSTKRKFYKSIDLIGDSAPTTGYIRHSEDDYTTSSAFRSIDMSLARPVVYQLGAGRRSSWEFFHSDGVVLNRIEALELEYDIGEQEDVRQ